MVTLLEEIFVLEDMRPALEERFGMVKMMKEFGKTVKKDKEKLLIKEAMNSQQQNNYKEVVKKKWTL